MIKQEWMLEGLYTVDDAHVTTQRFTHLLNRLEVDAGGKLLDKRQGPTGRRKLRCIAHFKEVVQALLQLLGGVARHKLLQLVWRKALKYREAGAPKHLRHVTHVR